MTVKSNSKAKWWVHCPRKKCVSTIQQTTCSPHNRNENKTIIWKENYTWEEQQAPQYWTQFIMNYSPSYQTIIKSSPGVQQKSCSVRNMSFCCKLHQGVSIHTCFSMRCVLVFVGICLSLLLLKHYHLPFPQLYQTTTTTTALLFISELE